MTYIVNNASLSMYADDHQLYITGNSVKYVEQSLNNEGQTISRWYGDNFLKGNYDKYNIMLMNGKNNSDLSINVNIDGHTIKSTPDLKLLGVTLDDKLNIIYMLVIYANWLATESLCLGKPKKDDPYTSQAPTLQIGNSTKSHVIQCGISVKRLTIEN